MAQRRHHFERAFEAYLRFRRIPYVAIDEAKRTLLPAATSGVWGEGEPGRELKTFDFVLYERDACGARNLLVDVKGRKISARAGRTGKAPRPRLENWATMDDVDSLRMWQGLFGPGFGGALVFVYWCETQPPDALFHEVFDFEGRWYAMRSVTIEAYTAAMKVRSPRWRTVDLPAAVFDRVSEPVGVGVGVGVESPAARRGA